MKKIFKAFIFFGVYIGILFFLYLIAKYVIAIVPDFALTEFLTTYISGFFSGALRLYFLSGNLSDFGFFIGFLIVGFFWGLFYIIIPMMSWGSTLIISDSIGINDDDDDESSGYIKMQD